ncbi:hypothetical protein [Gorillibacterium timonense]|uniref:hypothetical protein n=1 Tax=Gorillibacterium timonense TaxID=1689269 RepID=UPI00071E233A|nr:hypothetical protein [Gorillibacterium timonense]
MIKRSTRRASESAGSADRRKGKEAVPSYRPSPWGNPEGPAHVYIGPSLEGDDKEYVKVVSGRVTDRKPSFA